MKSIQDRIELNNGYKIPCVGFGTYNASPEEAEAAVAAAIRAGYRHIDGAAFYGNETGVGAGIRNSGIPREEIFVTGKVWKTDRGYDRTMAAFEKSLKDLGLEYLDLYLIHWPANYLVYGDDWKKVNRDTWKALEELYRAGRIRAIGVSNFLAHHLEALLETADIVPAVNQIELHPVGDHGTREVFLSTAETTASSVRPGVPWGGKRFWTMKPSLPLRKSIKRPRRRSASAGFCSTEPCRCRSPFIRSG